MSVTELLQQIEALPREERLELVEKLFQLTEADVPSSLRESMSEAGRGDLIDLDDALWNSIVRDLSRSSGHRC